MPSIDSIVIDLLSYFERFQYITRNNSLENSDAVYQLYSTVIKSITNLLSKEKRNSRIFRLKYHHILSDESVDEYLFHCLSKILTDILDAENNYNRYMPSVVELHMKLISILTSILQMHEEIVSNDPKVKSEIERYHSLSKKWKYIDDSINHGHFVPVYFIPVNKNSSHSKLKKTQLLTFQAITNYYENVDETIKRKQIDQIMELLLDFDDSFAEFEVNFVCQVNKTSILSKKSAEMTMDVAALFTEAIQWAHSKCLLKYSSIAECDIELMVSIPRIAILYGCGIAEDGPLSEEALNCHDESESESRLAPVFVNHYIKLSRLRRQLGVLNELEITYLTQLLIQHSDFNSSYSNNGDNNQKVPLVLSGDLHSLFILITSVADQMQTSHASDFRFFMELMYKLFKDEAENEDLNDSLKENLKLSSSTSTSTSLTIESSMTKKYQFNTSMPPRLKQNRLDEEAMDALNYQSEENEDDLDDDDDDDDDDGDNENQIIDNDDDNDKVNININLPTSSSSPPNTTPSSSSSIAGASPQSPLLISNSLYQSESNLLSTQRNNNDCKSNNRNGFKKSETSPNILESTSNTSNKLQARLSPPIVIGCTPNTLSSQRPRWRDDASYTHCCHCRNRFTLFRRRHHCRRCGFVFCHLCWGTKLALPSLGVTSRVPVCIECEEFVAKPYTTSITLFSTPTQSICDNNLTATCNKVVISSPTTTTSGPTSVDTSCLAGTSSNVN